MKNIKHAQRELYSRCTKQLTGVPMRRSFSEGVQLLWSVFMALLVVCTFAACSGGSTGPEPPEPPEKTDTDGDGIPDDDDDCPNDPTNTCGQPDMVTFTVTPTDSADGSVLEAAVVTLDTDGDGEADKEGEGQTEFTLDYAETTVEICAKLENYGKDCLSAAPTRDRELALELARAMITLTITTVLPEDNPPILASIFVDSKKVAEGSGKVRLFQREEDYSVKSTWGKAKVVKTVSGMEDQQVELVLPDLLNCADGIDNDGDGKRGSGDLGCVGTDNVTYDPSDDVEYLEVFVREAIGLPSDTTFVSWEHPRDLLTSVNFPNHVRAAVGEILVLDENLIESAESGESWSQEWQCDISPPFGPPFDISHTGTVEDDPEVDGWRFSKVPGIKAEFFE